MSRTNTQRGSTRVVGLGLTFALVVAAVAGGLALGAASWTQTPTDAASNAQESGPALVRVAHASPDTLTVNVTIDDKTVLTNVSFGNVSDYLRVAPGTHTVTVTETRTGGKTLVEESVTVEAGGNYTVAAAGESTVTGDRGIQTVVMEDNLTAASENESALRLAHFSPDAPAVTVTVQGTDRVLFENVSYLASTEYVTLPAGNYTLEVRPATGNGTGDVVGTFNVSLSGGNASTAFAIGYVNPEQAIHDQPFDLVVAGPNVSEPGPDTMITPVPETTPTPTEATPTPTETTPTPTGEEGNETGG